jgi:hypothetical protein
VSLVACRFVCTSWMRSTTSPPPPRDTHQQQWEQEEDWSKQFASNGWLALLQWAHANGCPWDPSTCANAARGGHLDVLQWARNNGCPWNEASTCANAALVGHLGLLQWARANGCPWKETTCAKAAWGGHLEVLQWARVGVDHRQRLMLTRNLERNSVSLKGRFRILLAESCNVWNQHTLQQHCKGISTVAMDQTGTTTCVNGVETQVPWANEQAPLPHYVG